MKPLVSVITVTYRAVGVLEQTLDSLSCQTFRNRMEVVVVDGGSDDGTVDILQRRSNEIDRWISEPDNGIYDAMNKGVSLAQGEWIIFMNAGDRFLNTRTVEEAHLEAEPLRLVYGHCIQDFGNYTLLDRCSPPERMPYQMVCSHQSLFARRSLLEEKPFDLRYRICGDYDFLSHWLAKGEPFRMLDFPVSLIQAEGFSGRRMKANLKEKKELALGYFPSEGRKIRQFYTLKLISLPVKSFLKAIVGIKFLRKFRTRKLSGAAPVYLIRLDDACPWHHRERWERVEQILDRQKVSPLAAVIPECRDPDLQKWGVDRDFWDRAEAWQKKGWSLGLHGWDHCFLTHRGGLVPLNRYSEFAGVPEAVQREKIRKAWASLKSRNLEIEWWVAPAHSFDRTTLKVLSEETTIRHISDGLYSQPFRRFGFTWIPQQLWNPRKLGAGVWTLCLHPNEMSDGDIHRLEEFLLEEREHLGNWKNYLEPGHWAEYSLFHRIYQATFLAAKNIRKFIRKMKSETPQVMGGQE